MRKCIHMFASNYKDLRKVYLETYNIELIPNAKAIRQKPYKINPKYAEVVEVDLKKKIRNKIHFIGRVY